LSAHFVSGCQPDLLFFIMAKDKKSFVAYCDWLESFEELTDEEAGKLAKHLFRYVNDLNPEPPDKITKMCFIPIKQSLKRDLVKYEERADRARENGAKGGRPKTQKTQLVISEPKKPDSVSVNVNDSVNVKDDGIKPPSLEEVISYFDENGYTKESATKMFEYYEESRKPRGRVWKDGRGNTVKNWKQKARSIWFKPDNLKSNKEYDFKNFENVTYP
jgi:hypothetical protein